MHWTHIFHYLIVFHYYIVKAVGKKATLHYYYIVILSGSG